jgi:hypothetical protein
MEFGSSHCSKLSQNLFRPPSGSITYIQGSSTQALEISECATGNEKASGYQNKSKNGAKFAQ